MTELVIGSLTPESEYFLRIGADEQSGRVITLNRTICENSPNLLTRKAEPLRGVSGNSCNDKH